MFDWFKRRNNQMREISLTSAEGWSEFFGGLETLSGVAVNAETAARFSTVFSCVRILSDAVAMLPCKIYRYKDDMTLPAVDLPLYNLLLRKPNSWMTSFDFWKFCVTDMLLRGAFLAHVVGFGKYQQLIPVPFACVSKIARNPNDGKLYFTYNAMYEGSYGTITIAAPEAFYCYYASTDTVNPLSPIAYNRETIGRAMAAEQHGANLFRNDATPPFVLKLPEKITPEGLKTMLKTWMETGSGRNYGKPRILEAGCGLEKVQMSNQDAQYLESRKFEMEGICGIFGVPPRMVGNASQAKGWSTQEQEMAEFVKLSLNPYIIRIERSADAWLLSDSAAFCKFTVNALLRGDIKTQTEHCNAFLDRGVYNPNEVRTLFDLNPRPGGDEYRVALNTTASGADKSPTENKGDNANA